MISNIRRSPASGRTRVKVGALVVAVALGAAACGSPSGSTESNGALSLTVGLPTPGYYNAALYWAKGQGIFDKLGLNLTIEKSGSVTTTHAATGKYVVANYGTTGMFPAQAQGRDQSIVICEGAGNAVSNVSVMGNSKYLHLEDLAGQPVGVVGTSGQSYGAASAYSTWLTGKGLAPLKIVTFADSGSLIAALQRNNVSATVYSSNYDDLVAKGTIREIISSTSDFALSVTGGKDGVCSATYFGLASGLKNNKTAVTRFVAGMRIADAQVLQHTPDDIADVLGKDPAFAPSVVSREALIGQLKRQQAFMVRNEGFVSEQAWAASLKQFGLWGLNVNGTKLDLNDSVFSYQKAVDMSYWNDATKLVEEYRNAGQSNR
ncbi:ABC transporter substrate-binding protein [Amycolatopsis alkalitolerans]|uniref:ABC transporter substrate-binding protein n=1 Tax=Amycolatopsis alkalitolerans TaxID=2547244 RepID=UPI001358C6DC|nr:ABC transporter substrate-binding protein [Amycolatopsis alkalitolerans]